MKECLSLLSTHLVVVIAKHESNRGKEVRLARSILTHNNIVLWREWIDHSLIFVALEALNDNLLDMHDVEIQS